MVNGMHVYAKTGMKASALTESFLKSVFFSFHRIRAMIRKASLFLLALMLILAVPSFFCPPVAQAEDAPKASKESGGDKKKQQDAPDVMGGRFAGDPIYVHVPPLVLPAINENGVEQLVTIILDIQVKDFGTADELHTNMPRVMDALMRALYGGLGQGSLRNGKLVDVFKVKSKATAAVGEIIGAAHVNDVLIQSVSQRML